MWNWQKINKNNSGKFDINQLNLPDFKHSVLLYEKRDGKKYAMVGYLSSIDENGAHWSSNMVNSLDEIFSGIFASTKKETFQPTHWCEIEIPEES